MYWPETCVLAETPDSTDTLGTGQYAEILTGAFKRCFLYSSHFGMINTNHFGWDGTLTTLLLSLLSKWATAKPHFSRYQLIS